MGETVTQKLPRKRWISGEVDADPFHLPQRITIPANEIMHRLFGFIRFAVVHKDAVKVTDSSPILGPFVWDEPMSAFRGVALRVAWRGVTARAANLSSSSSLSIAAMNAGPLHCMCRLTGPTLPHAGAHGAACSACR